MSSKYLRVSRHRTCLICGKPDWCSYTPDGKVSFCARLSQGADRISPAGWGVFYHEPSLFGNFPIPFPSEPKRNKEDLASIEIRDFAYRKLIELSPATNSKEVIEEQKGLRRRKILDFDNYGSLPKIQTERNEIARIIRQSLNREFPDFVRSQKSGLRGVPGFWLDKFGNSCLWLEKDYSNSMMLIPFRDEKGKIQACQIRFMGDLEGDSVRYLWLSTPKKNSGLSSGSPVHFGHQFSTDKRQTILLTEGALKAATIQTFLPTQKVIALAGVSCSHEMAIQIIRHCPLLIGFDNDYHENPQVVRHLAHLINLRILDSRVYGYAPDTKILVWADKFKGIDDALLNKAPIKRKSIIEWFKSLNQIVKNEAYQVLKNQSIESFR